jgi:hypothetical protein
MRKIFSILITFSLCCASYSSPTYDSVKQIATAMAKHNVYEQTTLVGFAATSSSQNERLNELIKIATDKQLYALAKHENAVVRLYALRAIIFRKLLVSPELRKQFYTDKSKVVILNGCIADNSSVDIISKMII